MSRHALLPSFDGPSAQAEPVHIGEVAQITGLTQRTIRYYEELGLLPAPERTQGDFRLYTEKDIRRLSEIARLKELLGLSLAEIKQMVEADEVREQLRTEFHAAEDAATRLEKLRQFESLTVSQMAILDRKMAQMAELRTELEARLTRYRERMSKLVEDDAQRNRA